MKISHKSARAFTLIELLVVIAIIGILSATIIAALNTARSKGSDASIKTDMSTIRNQAELDYDTLGNTYNNTGTLITCSGTACETVGTANTILADKVVQNALTSVALSNGAATTTSNIDLGISANGLMFSMAAALKTPGAGFWCIDNTGISRSATASGTPYTATTGSATAAHTAAGSTACN